MAIHKFIILLLILSIGVLQAQDDPKHSLSLSAGVAIAMGSFADDEAENDGYASSGLLLDLDAKIALNETIGVNFLYGQAEISTSYEEYRDKYLEYPENVSEGGNGVGLSWHLSRIFLGPTYSFNASDISFQARALGGLVLQDAFLISTDRGEVDYIIDDGISYYEQSIVYGKPSSSFGFQVGLNAAFPIGNKFGINSGFDYFLTNTDTNKVTMVNDNNLNFQNLSEKLEYNITALHFALGLIYKIQ